MTMMLAAILVQAGPASATAEPPATPVTQAAQATPAWLAGCWEEVSDRGWAEECWTVPRDGMALGSGRTGKGDKVRSWEAMQMIPGRDGVLTFWGSPFGRNRVAFPAETVSENELVFANPAHDYPQRIRYWREGDRLMAETSLSDGSRAYRWSFKRMGGE